MSYCDFSFAQIDQDLVIELAPSWLMHFLNVESMPLIPAPWGQRQADLCERKASLVCIVSPRPAGIYRETLSQKIKLKISYISVFSASQKLWDYWGLRWDPVSKRNKYKRKKKPHTKYKNPPSRLGMVTPAFNPSIQEGAWQSRAVYRMM